MARDVDDDGTVRRLAGEARARAAQRDRGVVVAADSNHFRKIRGIQRPDGADRKLAVVGRVGGIQGAVAGGELDFAAYAGAESRRKSVTLDADVPAGLRVGAHLARIPALPPAGWSVKLAESESQWNSGADQQSSVQSRVDVDPVSQRSRRVQGVPERQRGSDRPPGPELP